VLTLALFLAVVPAPLDLQSAPPDVAVEASYRPPAKAGDLATVLVRFSPSRPELRVNAEPAPRLKLSGESVLQSRQSQPTGAGGLDPEFAKYLDLAQPFEFPVELAQDAQPGDHLVDATVSFAYCSKSQGWCKRGNAPIEIRVKLH